MGFEISAKELGRPVAFNAFLKNYMNWALPAEISCLGLQWGLVAEFFFFLKCYGRLSHVLSVEDCWYWPGREKKEGISDGGNSCNQRGKAGKHSFYFEVFR